MTDLRLERRRGNATGDGMNLFVIGAIGSAGRVCWSVEEALDALQAHRSSLNRNLPLS